MINANEARHTTLSLDFLSRQQTYEAAVYYDDPVVETKTHVGIRRLRVTFDSSLEIERVRSGGAAIWIWPVAE